jgi:hypothetical protein
MSRGMFNKRLVEILATAITRATDDTRQGPLNSPDLLAMMLVLESSDDVGRDEKADDSTLFGANSNATCVGIKQNCGLSGKLDGTAMRDCCDLCDKDTSCEIALLKCLCVTEPNTQDNNQTHYDCFKEHGKVISGTYACQRTGVHLQSQSG